MIIKEWKCAEHGDFEGTLPLCPAMGCDSEHVERVFRTAPGFKSELTRRTDESLQKTADVYHLSDMSNKDGRAVKGNVDPTAAIWGKEPLGDRFSGMLSEASKPTQFTTPSGKQLYADNIGMRAACKSAGLDQHVLPPAEIIGSRKDAADRAIVAKASK